MERRPGRSFIGTGGNLIPPSAGVALFAPLAYLPLSIARAVCFVLSMTAFAVALALTARELRWSGERMAWAFAAFAVSYPAWLAWYQGQTVWLLSLPATISWRAYRHGRLTAAGLWLAPVIALKPPLASPGTLLSLWAGFSTSSSGWRLSGQLPTEPARFAGAVLCAGVPHLLSGVPGADGLVVGSIYTVAAVWSVVMYSAPDGAKAMITEVSCR